MQFTRLAVLLALGAGLGVSAWEGEFIHSRSPSIMTYQLHCARVKLTFSIVTAYMDNLSCNDDNKAGAYRDLTGSDGKCHNFGVGEGVTCGHYYEGGVEGPFECSDGVKFAALSVWTRGGCEVFDQLGCQGNSVFETIPGADPCLKLHRRVRSFECK